MQGDELRPPSVFTGLVDLAAASLGGRALGTSDDFFASVENLVQPGRGEWREGAYTDRGKWMDGWESRRRRGGGPFDWAVVELGAPGLVRAFDIDTNHFTGNHAAFAAVDLVAVEPGEFDLEAATWTEVLPPTPLAGGAQNLLLAAAPTLATHARLRIYPDGGVARFRVYGDVQPRWPALDQRVDLAALRNGGRALACSDMFFSPMANAIAPGDPADMGGGWETRRRRHGRPHDWLILELGARGTVERVELDTLFFKGNYPDRASVLAVDAPGASTPELMLPDTPWRPLVVDEALDPDARHAFDLSEPTPPFTHVRLDIVPDGGISRLRVLGKRTP